MKSFTGNSSSARGWALLLAFLLGAGMMISACGDEETPAPTTPEPTPAPPPAPPPAPEPTGPATPENLRVSGSTSTSITWMWDAVEGALGYQGQFSTDATFADADPTFIIVAPSTSHTVSNLSGNMTGHFRVRSGTGTSLTDLTYSDWTEGVSGSTAAPPPATALAAPGGLSAGSATDDSVTLTWDEVDNADNYEVEQRLAGAGGNWGDADCGDTGSNEVDGTSCVASGLDEGTDYEFRVRGIPTDDAYLAGAWAETDGGTTGRQETTVSGGMGDLNVTWKSTADTVTFSWEPMAGTTYEWKEIGTDDATRLAALDRANPCAGADFFDAPTGMGANFSHQFTSVAAGDIRGLCVRIDDDDLDDDEKALSWGWGAATPVAPTAAAAATIDTMDEKQVATALDWTAIMLKKGFEWELRLVADSGRGDGDLDGAPTAKAVQNACDAGTFVDQGDALLNLSINYTWDGAISPYTGYLLCLKYANTAGSTAWAVPGSATAIDEIYSPPARPPSPQYRSSLSTTSADGSTRTLVWMVPTWSANNVPLEAADFEVKYITYPVRYDHDGDTANSLVSTPAPTSCVAGDITDGPSNLQAGGTNPWAPGDPSETNDLDGFRVTSAGITIPENDAQNLAVRLCVRATKDSAGDTLNGPWVIGGNATIAKKSS